MNIEKKRIKEEFEIWMYKSQGGQSPPKTKMASWKITIFSRRYICKWLSFHCDSLVFDPSFSSAIQIMKPGTCEWDPSMFSPKTRPKQQSKQGGQLDSRF